MNAKFFGAALCVSALACGGDGGSAADAGPDAPPMAEGSSARQVYDVAWALATDVATDAILTNIRGTLVKADSGEVDDELQGSYWQIDFESESTNQLINVLYSRGDFTVTPGLPRGMQPFIRTEWKNSTETVEKMKSNGYTPPGAPPPEYQLAMNLAVFVTSNEMDPRHGVEEPFWQMEVIHDPPGGTPQSEAEFFVTWRVMTGMWMICDLGTRMCNDVP
jgi:hypothetical protein